MIGGHCCHWNCRLVRHWPMGIRWFTNNWGNIPCPLLDEAGERLAVDELHCIVMNTTFAADAVDGNDVGMFQRRRRAGFVLEALQVSRVHSGCEGQDLQCDAPA